MLLSDGKSQGGRDTDDVARAAGRLKVPIYTVALGTPDGVVEGPFGDPIPVPPDPAQLRRIARFSGGRAFQVQDADRLDAVYETLGSQLGTKPRKREVTAAFAGAGLLLLLARGRAVRSLAGQARLPGPGIFGGVPRCLLGALVALALAPAAAGAVTPSVAVRSVAAGCAPEGRLRRPRDRRCPPSRPARTPTWSPRAARRRARTLPVTTTATEGAVRLRWTALPGATGYTIYRDGETVATGVACCDYTDTSPATTPGAPPPVAAESARAGSGPDLVVTEDLAYDDPDETLATDVLRLPAGLFLTGAVDGRGAGGARRRDRAGRDRADGRSGASHAHAAAGGRRPDRAADDR